MAPRILKKININIKISYGGKATISIIRLEDCCVMLLFNHTLTMDVHDSILSYVRP